ncbi:hypothetical protein MHN79_20425 [Vibrio sp. Of14-4]|uniref:hypothetical protein n=1 Tax=Vibrio sp. Of14-4 TaxID=2724878 RepID=UPI001EF36208|nr:hypothetical protein [Vibrio sp. Of14-4]MCG7491844.1 hypothetical protein [Vibrio sp. Of14-4]
MKTHKKRHQKLLHHCLTKRKLSQDAFLVLTSLTDEEVYLWLSSNLGQVRKIVSTLGYLVEYQLHRSTRNSRAILELRAQLEKRLCLWSDAASLQSIPENMNSLQLGLLMLAQYNKRLATLWSIRLGLDIPATPLMTSSPYRLSNVVHQVLAPILVQSDEI